MPNPSATAVDPEAVRAIVAEVLRRIATGLPEAVAGPEPQGGSGGQPASPDAGSQGVPVIRPSSGAGSPQVCPTEAGRKPGRLPAELVPGVTLPGGVISLAMVEQLPAGARRVTIEPRAVVTPSAREHAGDKGIVIERKAAADATGGDGPGRVPFIVVHAECRGDAAARAAGIARAIPGGSQLPASGLAEVVEALALHAARDAARGVLLTGQPVVATVLANRSAAVRAVTGRDPAALAAAAAECNANLLVLDPMRFPAAAAIRLAKELAARPTGDIPAALATRPAGCGCKGH